ncbi:MAG: hypothetical protein IE914_06125, partial [Thiotrichales bacterium]|nr:hypothetical protein [Thiotrichales bacterium]
MKNLKASLPATMAGIASKAGLKLAFGQPRTDGRTVWVSDIPLNPSEDDYNIVVSDLIHEVGHIKFTDFNVNRGGHPLMPALTNVFEDVRIEKELQAEFLGARTFLDEGYKVLMAKGQNRKPDSAANALTMWLLLDHMIKVNGRSFFTQSRDEAYQACMDFGASPELLDEIQALCDQRVYELKSTADAVQLSKEVVDLLKQTQEENEQQSQQEQQPQNGQDSDEDQDQQNQQSSQGSSSENEGEQQEADGEGDEGDGQSESQSQGNASGDSDEQGDEQDAGQGDEGSSSNSQQESQDGSQESNGGADGESDEADSDTEEESNSKGCSKGGAKELLESKVDEKSPLSLR